MAGALQRDPVFLSMFLVFETHPSFIRTQCCAQMCWRVCACMECVIKSPGDPCAPGERCTHTGRGAQAVWPGTVCCTAALLLCVILEEFSVPPCWKPSCGSSHGELLGCSACVLYPAGDWHGGGMGCPGLPAEQRELHG